MKYAEIALDVPPSIGPSFTYTIPDVVNRFVRLGQLVFVPFRTRTVIGIVVALSPFSAVASPRPISRIALKSPLLSPVQLQLAFWMSRYYRISLFRILIQFLPPGYIFRNGKYIKSLGISGPILTQSQSSLLHSIPKTKWTSVTKLTGNNPEAANILDDLSQLKVMGLIDMVDQIIDVTITPKFNDYLSLTYHGKEAFQKGLIDKLRASRRFQLVQELALTGHPVLKNELKVRHSSYILKVLEEKGYLLTQKLRQLRVPAVQVNASSTQVIPIKGSPVTSEKTEMMFSKYGNKLLPMLIKGGSTSENREMYLALVASCIATGKKALILLPDTWSVNQLSDECTSRFTGQVAIFHSGLSQGEQYDQWEGIQKNKYNVIVGSRNALFLPVKNLGLIVCDSEHDWSYEHDDVLPSYNARKTAAKLAELSKAHYVMSSVTPSVETYYETQGRIFHPPSLLTKHTPFARNTAEIIDMRLEGTDRTSTIISAQLRNALRDCLRSGGQAALLLNRRGTAAMVYCRACGYIFRCVNCDYVLTRRSGIHLYCNNCRSGETFQDKCSSCSSQNIVDLGTGTEKVKQEVMNLFPDITVMKWDKDSAPDIKTQRTIAWEFAQQNIDVVVGTQMILKGLAVSSVSLIGVINADIGLQSTDFRSNEKTFQLLGNIPRQLKDTQANLSLIIQTYQPSHYAILSGLRKDYESFYEREISDRQKFQLPPFTKIVKVSRAASDSKLAREEITELSAKFRENLGRSREISSVVGPVPSHPYRFKGRYKWDLLLVGQNPSEFLHRYNLSSNWIIDVDPVTVF